MCGGCDWRLTIAQVGRFSHLINNNQLPRSHHHLRKTSQQKNYHNAETGRVNKAAYDRMSLGTPKAATVHCQSLRLVSIEASAHDDSAIQLHHRSHHAATPVLQMHGAGSAVATRYIPNKTRGFIFRTQSPSLFRTPKMHALKDQTDDVCFNSRTSSKKNKILVATPQIIIKL